MDGVLKMEPPRCRECWRVDAEFEKEWMNVYKQLKGAQQGGMGDLGEKLEGMVREMERGGDRERKVGDVMGRQGAYEVWVRAERQSGAMGWVLGMRDKGGLCEQW